MTEPKKLCVGLTGGIGSGKSTAGEFFKELGAHVIDTDAISHELTGEQGLAIPAIRAAFGPEYITPSGALDRGKMRRLIIEDAQAKAKLEHILHPMILDTCKTRMLTDAPYLVLMAPLLLEAPDFLGLVDRVLLIDCAEQNQIARVMQRSALSEAEISGIIALQLSRQERKIRADDIIQNDGPREDLKLRIAAFHQHYLDLINNHLTTD
jgi:dephospho-CoA kinase